MHTFTHRFLFCACAAFFLVSASAQTKPPLPPCRADMHVPPIGPLNYGGTILAVDETKGSYQVKSDRGGLVDWVKAYNLRYSCAGVEAKPVSDNFFAGKWELFVGPTPHYEVKVRTDTWWSAPAPRRRRWSSIL